MWPASCRDICCAAQAERAAADCDNGRSRPRYLGKGCVHAHLSRAAEGAGDLPDAGTDRTLVIMNPELGGLPEGADLPAPRQASGDGTGAAWSEAAPPRAPIVPAEGAGDAARGLRSALHRFAALETGGFGLPADVGRSFDRLGRGLTRAFSGWAGEPAATGGRT
jgi:hypothetical protein